MERVLAWFRECATGAPRVRRTSERARARAGVREQGELPLRDVHLANWGRGQTWGGVRDEFRQLKVCENLKSAGGLSDRLLGMIQGLK